MITGLPADIVAVQNSGHRVEAHLYTRTPAPATGWLELKVIEATVTYDAAGSWPGRSLDAVVLLETDGNENVTESIDVKLVDWGHAPLSVFGSWIKAEQWVYRLDNSPPIIVPWGVYRVDELSIDPLNGQVRITAPDASAQIADRPFVTVNQGRVLATESIQTKMGRILTDVFAGITPWWTSLIDYGGLADKTFGGRGGQYVEYARLDALTSLTIRLQSGWRPICPRSGPVIKLIQPGRSSDPSYVTAGVNLIFDDFSDVINRQDLFNEVVLTYEVTQPDSFGQTRTQQRRVIAQYVDAGEELAGTGPFGWVTRESVQVDIPTGTANPDQYVKDKALEVMGRSFSASRIVTVKSGPIYGLEQGDPVYVQVRSKDDSEAIRRLGTLVGATIPLNAAQGQPWELQLAMTDTLDPGWRPRYLGPYADSTTYEDNFEWQALKPTGTVDLDTGTGSGTTKKLWVGWATDNDSKTIGGTSLTATSNGGNVTFRTTGQPWSEGAAEHRYNAKASITAVKGSMSVRIGLDTNAQGVIWSAWKSFAAGKTTTVSIDTKRLINPAATTFGLRIETQGMSAGEQVRMNSVSVEKAVRNKS